MTPSNPSQKAVRLSDLRPGDVAFTLHNSRAMHVQVFGGKAVFDSTTFHPVYDQNRPEGPRKLMATSFTPYSDIRVYRCRRPELAARASQIARNWAAFETKFDWPRLLFKIKSEEEAGPMSREQRRAKMRHFFMWFGRYRALKFTIRCNSIMCSPGGEDGFGRGMTCCMFAILCFQAAGLIPYVELISPPHWVSDKKVTEAELEQIELRLAEQGFDRVDINIYKSYLCSLHSTQPYGRLNHGQVGRFTVTRVPNARTPGLSYYPSLYFWKKPPFHSFNFAGAMTPALLLDAKIARAEDFRQAIRGDSENWEALGNLPDDSPRVYSEQEKQAYKTTLAERASAAAKLRAPFTRQS